MADIIDITKYKNQKRIRIKNIRQNEEELANQILASSNYHEMVATPIVKITQNYGIKVYRDTIYKNNKAVAGQLLVGGDTKSFYNYNQVIFVNKNNYIFEQRVVVARLLAHYLIDRSNKNQYRNIQEKLFSVILDFGEVYDKYEEFILNILAPNPKFIQEYNRGVKAGLTTGNTYTYLSKYFEVPEAFIVRKVKSLKNIHIIDD